MLLWLKPQTRTRAGSERPLFPCILCEFLKPIRGLSSNLVHLLWAKNDVFITPWCQFGSGWDSLPMGMQAIPSQSQAEQAPSPKAHIYTELIQQGAGCLTVTLLAKLSICIGIWPSVLIPGWGWLRFYHLLLSGVWKLGERNENRCDQCPPCQGRYSTLKGILDLWKIFINEKSHSIHVREWNQGIILKNNNEWH